MATSQTFQSPPVAPHWRSLITTPLQPQPQRRQLQRLIEDDELDYYAGNTQQVQSRRPEQQPYANGAEVDRWELNRSEVAGVIAPGQQLQQQQQVSRQWSAPVNVGDETLRHLEQLSQLIDSWDSRLDIGVLTLTVRKFVSQLTSQRTVSEFLSSPFNGLPVLVRLLYNIQTDLVLETDGVTPREGAQYIILDDEHYLSQLQSVERNILQCLERFTHFENSRAVLLTDTVAVRTIVTSTTNHGGNDINALALKILTSLCDSQRNADVILQAFTDHANDINASLQPFGPLIKNLKTTDDVVYMVNCLKLLNALYRQTTRGDCRRELHNAELDIPRLRQFASRCTDRYAAVQLSDEIEIWEWLTDDVRGERKANSTRRFEVDRGLMNGGQHDNFVDVYANQDRDDDVFYHARETNRTPAAVGQFRQNSVPNEWRQSDIDRLRNEINALRQQLTFAETCIGEWEEAAKRMQVDAAELEAKRQQLEQQCGEYYSIAQQNKALADKLRSLYRDRMGRDPEVDVQFQDFVQNNSAAMEPVNSTVAKAGTDFSHIQRNAQQTNYTGGAQANVTTIAASVPLSFIANTVRVKLTNRANLPLLHWTPLSATETTMFQDIDSESIIRQLDFNDFEAMFERRSARPMVKEETPRDAMLSQQMSIPAERIEFVESQRARHMIITQKKTKMTAEDLKLAIESSDIKRLPGEYAELLVKYVPTNDERKHLHEIDPSQHVKFGEAEMFLYHMDQIERMESKLNVMVFMGQFDELVATIIPSIEQLRVASESVFQSLKLRRLFEFSMPSIYIVLAFGNYMNGAKRGFAYGFKLDSLAKLSEVKSQVDRNITLLHYIAGVITDKYPDIGNFFDELKIDIDRTVSYQGITASMLTLSRGIDIVEYELGLQPQNVEISVSFMDLDRLLGIPPLDSTIGRRFLKKMFASGVNETFYESANPIVVQIQQEFHDMQDSYRSVCLMFAENFRQIEPQEIFGPITAFIASFRKAVNDNYQRTHPTVKPQVVNFKHVPTPRRPPPTPIVVQISTDAAVLTPVVKLRQKPLTALRHVEPQPGGVSFVINGKKSSMVSTVSKLGEPDATGNNRRQDDVTNTDVSANTTSQQQKQRQQQPLKNSIYVSHSKLSARFTSTSDLPADRAVNNHSSDGDVNEADHAPVNGVSSNADQAKSAGDDVRGQYYNVANDASVYESIGDNNYAEVNSVKNDDVTSHNSAVYENVTGNEYTNTVAVTDEQVKVPADESEDSYL